MSPDPELEKTWIRLLTSYRPDLLRALPSDQKDNVSLRGIHSVVFKKEDLIDSIFLKRAELDKKAYSTSQRLFDDQVLLASYLDLISMASNDAHDR